MSRLLKSLVDSKSLNILLLYSGYGFETATRNML